MKINIEHKLTSTRRARLTPGLIASTFPSLLRTKTPRMVPLGAFFMPIALIRFAAGSQSNVYGRLCLVLKVVLDLGESVERP